MIYPALLLDAWANFLDSCSQPQFRHQFAGDMPKKTATWFTWLPKVFSKNCLWISHLNLTQWYWVFHEVEQPHQRKSTTWDASEVFEHGMKGHVLKTVHHYKYGIMFPQSFCGTQHKIHTNILSWCMWHYNRVYNPVPCLRCLASWHVQHCPIIFTMSRLRVG